MIAASDGFGGPVLEGAYEDRGAAARQRCPAPRRKGTARRPRPGTAGGCGTQRAPTAMRRPISRVRSVTETSMMFMMPTPPTTSEISGHHQQQRAHRLRGRSQGLGDFGHVADVEIVGIGRGLMRCRSRSSSVIWLDRLLGCRRSEAALARIWSTLVKRTGCGVSAAWVATATDRATWSRPDRDCSAY